MNNACYYILYLASVTIAAFSQFLLKKSANRSHDSFLKEYLNPYVIGGYGLLSGIFLKERITSRKVAGTALILAGILVFYL